MSKTAAISLVTITRDCGAALRETLGSVAAQTWAPAEHIIVDGMSADGTLALCREYAASVTYPVKIMSREPHGVYDALNCGISASSGPVTGSLHGGDRFAGPAILETMSKTFESDPDLMLAYGDIRHTSRSGKPGAYYSGDGFRPGLLKWGFMPPHPSVYCRRELFERHGLYTTDFLVAGDFEWLARVLLKEGERSRYVPVCAVIMAPGGLSTRPRNRLLVTPREKVHALRRNGVRVCPLRMAARYVFALTSIFKKRND